MLKTLFRSNKTHLQAVFGLWPPVCTIAQSFRVLDRPCDPLRQGKYPAPLGSTLLPGIFSVVTYVPSIHHPPGLRHRSLGQVEEQITLYFLNLSQVLTYKSIPSSSVLLLIKSSKLDYRLARIVKSTDNRQVLGGRYQLKMVVCKRSPDCQQLSLLNVCNN